MENWNNLNKVLILERQDFAKRELESQELVELCSSELEDFKEIKLLLKKGAALNCYADLSTPLISAIRSNNITLGTFLLNMGASITYHPMDLEDDAFWEALINKRHDFLKLFIEKRCPLKRRSSKITPLIYATIERDVKGVELLLQHYNIKVNDIDGNRNTALHYNVSNEPQTEEDTEIGKMLVAAGAEINSVNLDGQTPQDMALDSTARSMLLYAKLDRDIPNKDEEMEPEVEPNTPNMPVKKTMQNKIKI